MPEPMFSIEAVLAMLPAAPPSIAALTADLSPAQLKTAPGSGEWSANEVLGHLRACSDMWGDAILAILAQNKPKIRAVNPRSWIKKTNYLGLDFHTSLQAYTLQRENLISILKPLSPDSWALTAVFTGAGAPIVRSVHSFGSRLVRHERPHIKQIACIAEALRP